MTMKQNIVLYFDREFLHRRNESLKATVQLISYEPLQAINNETPIGHNSNNSMIHIHINLVKN